MICDWLNATALLIHTTHLDAERQKDKNAPGKFGNSKEQGI